MSTFGRLISRLIAGALKNALAAPSRSATKPTSTGARSYPAELVGEQHHAGARSCRVGQQVWLRVEPSNPHDDLAIQAIDARGVVIGYLPRDSWLRRAVHDEGKGALCHVSRVEKRKGITQVTLDVQPRPRKDTAHRVLDAGETP